MAAIRCPSCANELNVSDQYAGRKVRCPKCQGVLAVPPLSAPEASEEVTPTVPRPRRPAMPPLPDEGQPAARRSARPPDDYDDRPRRRPPLDEDDDRPRRRRGSEWAPCPNCGNDDASRVHWTFWGGLIGPAIINVVRCHQCGTNYNGVHGDTNGGRIAIYIVVSIVLGLLIAGVVIAVAAMNN